MQREKQYTPPREALKDLRKRGSDLRMRMIRAGFSQYARAFAAWHPALAKDPAIMHRIRMVGLGRAQHHDRDLLELCEKLAAKHLAQFATRAAA